MSPTDAIALLAPAFAQTGDAPASPSAWADLGSGSGVFTLALASLLPPGSLIYAVDHRPGIHAQSTPNNARILTLTHDFVRDPLPCHQLDGILMANSLHYVKLQAALIERLRKNNLRPNHQFLIVEYDTDRPTPAWVPYPVSFSSLQSLFQALGYHGITRLADQPSIYNRNSIYSARIS